MTMAGKKTSKSSKTDHVLNLISGISTNQEESSPAEEKNAARTSPEKAAPAKETVSKEPPAKEPAVEPESAETPSQAAPAPYRAAPILEVARTNHEALSETVHQALENALEEELREEEKQHELEKAVQTEKEAASSPQTEQAAPAPLDTHETQSETIAEKAAPSQEAAEPAETEIVNVMQILVSENVDRYVDMFQVCRCSRCMADVQALALTNLPAKYVVMDRGKFSSMLGFYRHSYSSTVMIELTKACNVVKQNPHHKL